VLRRAREARDKLRADIVEWCKGVSVCAMAWRDVYVVVQQECGEVFFA